MESLQMWVGLALRPIRRWFHCVITPNVCKGEKRTWWKIIIRMAGARGLTAGSRKSSSLKHQTGPRTPHISKTHRILEIKLAELYSAKRQGRENNENLQTSALFSTFSSHVYEAHDSFRMLGNFDVILSGLNYGPGLWGQCCGPFDCQGPPRCRTWLSKTANKRRRPLWHAMVSSSWTPIKYWITSLHKCHIKYTAKYKWINKKILYLCKYNCVCVIY